jgi:hypothetical protein
VHNGFACGAALDNRRIPPEVVDIAREIASYLLNHPEAKDTAEGILKWWMPTRLRGWRQEEVNDAISLLEHRHLVERCQASSFVTLWGLNQGVHDRIAERLHNDFT